MADGRIEIEVDVDTDNASRGFKKIEKESNSLIKNFLKLETFKFTSIASGLSALTPLALGLASSLGASAVALGGFGAVAVTELKKVFDASEELKKLNEQLAETDDLEKRAEIMGKIAEIQKGLTTEQKKALTALEDFKKFWNEFTTALQKPVLNTFVIALEVVKKIMEGLQPTISATATVFEELFTELLGFIESGKLQFFFDWLETNGAESVRNFAKIFGNVFIGVFKLLEAFAPVGAMIEEFLVRLTGKFANMELASQTFNSAMDSMLKGLIDFVVNGIDFLLKKLVEFTPLILERGVKITEALIRGIIQLIPKLVTAITGIMEQIGTTLKKNFPSILKRGTELLIELIKGIFNAIPDLIVGIVKLVVTIVKVLYDNRDQIKESGQQIIEAIIRGLANMIGKLGKAIFDYIIKPIGDKLVGLGKDAYEWGADIIRGLIDGLQSKLKKVEEFFSGIKKKVQSVFDIHSPSKWARDMIGKNIMIGFGNGLENGIDLNSIMNGIKDKMVNGLFNNPQTQTSNTTNNNQRSFSPTINMTIPNTSSESDVYRRQRQQMRILGAEMGLI